MFRGFKVKKTKRGGVGADLGEAFKLDYRPTEMAGGKRKKKKAKKKKAKKAKK